MRRLFNYLINNVREHLILYITLWLLVALIYPSYFKLHVRWLSSLTPVTY
ncbi:MAG: hypothetical protein H6R25_4213 [Proteobacteria bacterium]|nr:hypothetical protein [Pseudomonadota bacterium]